MSEVSRDTVTALLREGLGFAAEVLSSEEVRRFDVDAAADAVLAGAVTPDDNGGRITDPLEAACFGTLVSDGVWWLKGSATRVATIADGDWTGEITVYRVDPPLEGWQHVIASATRVPPSGRSETFLFPAKRSASSGGWGIADWGELPGSVRDVLDHGVALARAGYVVVSDDDE